MVCYWGCGTTQNKINWGVIIAMGIAGAAIAIAGGAGGASGNPSCFSQVQNCTGSGKSQDTCSKDFPCAKTYTGLILAGIIIFLVGVFAPMSYFCCCSENPETASQRAFVPQAAYYNPNQAPPPPPAYYYPPPGSQPPAIPMATYTPPPPYVPPAPVPDSKAASSAEPVVGLPYNPIIAQPWSPPEGN